MEQLNALNYQDCQQGPDRQSIAIEKAKQAFLTNIAKGQDEKEAFLNSLSVVKQKYNPSADSYEGVNECNLEDRMTIGSASKFLSDPNKIKAWLEVISMSIPILQRIIDVMMKKQVEENSLE